MSVRAAAVIALAVCLAGLGGCASPEGPRFARPEALPSYPEAARRFNVRVERLSRVWSRVNITLRTPKDTGGTSVDRAEGHLQLEQPDRTALSINKLGETYFYLGSDADGYWWLDMSDGDRKVGLYGRHAEATPELVAELGLPVHPRELLEIFAITPLPVRGEGQITEPGVASWDESLGMLRIETASMWGRRLLWVDPVTMAPQRVELRDGRGGVRAVCEMGRYISAPVRGDGRVPPKLASQYRLQMPETGTRVTLELYGAENRPISARAFDFEELLEAYGIDEVYLLGAGGGAVER